MSNGVELKPEGSRLLFAKWLYETRRINEDGGQVAVAASGGSNISASPANANVTQFPVAERSVAGVKMERSVVSLSNLISLCGDITKHVMLIDEERRKGSYQGKRKEREPWIDVRDWLDSVSSKKIIAKMQISPHYTGELTLEADFHECKINRENFPTASLRICYTEKDGVEIILGNNNRGVHRDYAFDGQSVHKLPNTGQLDSHKIALVEQAQKYAQEYLQAR